MKEMIGDDVALGLAVGNPHPAHVDEVELAAAAVAVGIDLGTVGGHGGIGRWSGW